MHQNISNSNSNQKHIIYSSHARTINTPQTGWLCFFPKYHSSVQCITIWTFIWMPIQNIPSNCYIFSHIIRTPQQWLISYGKLQVMISLFRYKNIKFYKQIMANYVTKKSSILAKCYKISQKMLFSTILPMYMTSPDINPQHISISREYLLAEIIK